MPASSEPHVPQHHWGGGVAAAWPQHVLAAPAPPWFLGRLRLALGRRSGAASHSCGLTAAGPERAVGRVRFKYAGTDPALTQVMPDRGAALHGALARTPPGESLYIFAGYTPMRELRSIMQRHAWVPPFWEE
jgi:hypothetical protein